MKLFLLLSICLCGHALALPSAERTLSFEDVSSIISMVTAPYQNVQKTLHVHFTQASEKMLSFLESISSKLQKVHLALSSEIQSGTEKINKGRHLLANVELDADLIIAELENLRETCSTRLYQLSDQASGLAQIGVHPQPADHHDPYLPGHDGSDVSSQLEEMLSLRSAMANIGQDPVDLGEVLGDVLSKFDADSLVSLADVLNAMQQMGQLMEQQVLMTMPARMSRAEKADEYIKAIYHHVTGIFDAVLKLKSITSQTDVQTIARVERKIASIASVLHNIECAE